MSADGSAPRIVVMGPSGSGKTAVGTALAVDFGVDFVDERGRPDPRFVRRMQQLRSMDGYFAPVSAVLDRVREQRGVVELDRSDRVRLERAWIVDRLASRSRFGPRVQTHEMAST